METQLFFGFLFKTLEKSRGHPTIPLKKKMVFGVRGTPQKLRIPTLVFGRVKLGSKKGQYLPWFQQAVSNTINTN